MIPASAAPESLVLPHLANVGLTARDYDVNGWPEIRGNPISKVGVFPYLGKSIDARLEPDRIYYVLRPEEELNNPETIQSFCLLPWVDDHPNVLLGPQDAGRVPAEQKGVHGVIGEEIYYSDGVLYANLKIFSDDLAELIESGKRELSVGYGCRYELSSGIWNGIHYDAIQRSIRGNHIATVTEGRMGPDVAVLDQGITFSFDAKDIKMADETKNEDVEMTAEQVAEFLNKFGKDQSKLKGMIDKHFGSDKGDDMGKEGCDADEDKEKKEKEAADKAAADKSAKDAEEEKEKDKKDDEKSASDSKAAMDAVAQIRKDVADWKDTVIPSLTKKIMGEMRQRDKLAAQISGVVGSFDASEMTLAEVASYGVKKIDIQCEKGHEATALSAFFMGRGQPARQAGFGHDAVVSQAQDQAVVSIIDYYKKSAA